MPRDLSLLTGHCPSPESNFFLSWTPPEPTTKRNMLASFFARNGRTYAAIGTIGHVDWGMKPLSAAIIYNLPAVRHKLKRMRDWFPLDRPPYYTQASDF